MPENTTIEALIERCVEAGVAARRAHAAAIAFRHDPLRSSPLTAEDRAWLVELEAKAERLSRLFLDSQAALAAAGTSQFQERLRIVASRVESAVR